MARQVYRFEGDGWFPRVSPDAETVCFGGGGSPAAAPSVRARHIPGGGEWLLLTAMLGLAEPDQGEKRLEWIAAHATPEGDLPEQSQDHLLHPDQFDVWVAKWGLPPSPLLWSHAMFLTLDHELHGG